MARDVKETATLNGWMLLIVASLALESSPARELAAAEDDLRRRTPIEAWSQTRYVTFYNLPRERRELATAVLSLVLNSVSRTAVIASPEVVPGSEGRLVRVRLDRYGLAPEAWDAMAIEEPYWHLRTEVIDPRDGRVREVATDGGWVGLERAAQLREATGSAAALARGDWLIATASAPPHYYNLAGVPATEKEFLSGLGIDKGAIARLRSDRGANLIRSGVTYKLRRVVRRQAPAGGAWQTYDVARNAANNDPIRNPFDFDYDAGEHIAARPNGLHLFALFDRKGARQDEVPARIARDHADRLGPGIIVPMVSCVRCHVEDGLRGFGNDQQALLERNIDLFTERADDAERLAAFYGASLAKSLARDREDYAVAVGAACGGRGPREMAAALGEMVEEYLYRLVDRAAAARELGIEEAAFAQRMRAAHDVALLALAEGVAVQREQWEAAFGEAALLAAE